MTKSEGGGFQAEGTPSEKALKLNLLDLLKKYQRKQYVRQVERWREKRRCGHGIWKVMIKI